MAKFIKLTNVDDEAIYVNVDNILWIEPCEESSTIIRVACEGKNNYPVSLFVNEPVDTVVELINAQYGL